MYVAKILFINRVVQNRIFKYSIKKYNINQKGFFLNKLRKNGGYGMPGSQKLKREIAPMPLFD